MVVGKLSLMDPEETGSKQELIDQAQITECRRPFRNLDTNDGDSSSRPAAEEEEKEKCRESQTDLWRR